LHNSERSALKTKKGENVDVGKWKCVSPERLEENDPFFQDKLFMSWKEQWSKNGENLRYKTYALLLWKKGLFGPLKSTLVEITDQKNEQTNVFNLNCLLGF
jgi:hypothetical protein